MVVAPNCPYEGWGRQVVRDIADVERCLRDQTDEVRFVLAINKRGVLTRVSIEPPMAVNARNCVADAVWAWEFASARRAGELRVVYRPGATSS